MSGMRGCLPNFPPKLGEINMCGYQQYAYLTMLVGCLEGLSSRLMCGQLAIGAPVSKVLGRGQIYTTMSQVKECTYNEPQQQQLKGSKTLLSRPWLDGTAWPSSNTSVHQRHSQPYQPPSLAPVILRVKNFIRTYQNCPDPEAVASILSLGQADGVQDLTNQFHKSLLGDDGLEGVQEEGISLASSEVDQGRHWAKRIPCNPVLYWSHFDTLKPHLHVGLNSGQDPR